MASLRKIILRLFTFVLYLLEILISLFISALILPFVIILVFVNETVRIFVAGCLRIKFGGTVKLSEDQADSCWSFKKPGNGRISLILVFYKNQLEVEKYRELFLNRVINYQTGTGFKPYERLTHIITKHLGYICRKKDENFNIKNHVRYYPGSQNKIVTEIELLEKILPELSVDMEDSAPQWEEVIMPKFQYNVNDKEARKLAGEGGTVCVRIFRYHHGYMDAVSNLLMWVSCMFEGEEFPFVVDPLAPLKTPLWKRMIYYSSCILLGATSLIRASYVTSTLNNRFVTENYTGKRVFAWTPPIEISQLNEIRVKTKYSMPTILAAAIGGALRKLMQKYPSNKEQFKTVPNEVVIALVAAMTPYPNIHLRNRIIVVPYAINTSEVSPIQRLQLANEEMGKASKDPANYVNYVACEITGRLPHSISQRFIRNCRIPSILSNAPMTIKNIKFWDNEVVDCIGWPPLIANMGFGILTARYADHLRVCTVADEACLSETELKYFMIEMRNEIRLLFEECLRMGGPQQIIYEDNQLPMKKLLVKKTI